MNTTNLTQEQVRNARRSLLRMQSNGYAPRLDELPDLGGLRTIFSDLISAKVQGGQDGLTSALEALRPDFPILDELRKPGKYQPLTLLELAKRPPPAWIIRHYLYEKTVGELYGEGGCKKTFLALDWCASTAMGISWLGMHDIVKPGNVVYLLAEGADSFMQRVYAWCKHHQIRLEDLSKRLFIIPKELPLSNSAEVTEYIDDIAEFLHNVEPTLLVFDTLLRCAEGQNINAPDVMSALYAGANRARNELNAAHALIIHHEGKDRSKGGAGSFVLRSNVDAVYHLERDKTTNLLTLVADKLKDKPETTTYLNTECVYYGEDQTNNDECSLVIIPGEKPAKQVTFNGTQKKMLAVLDCHTTLPYATWQELCSKERDIKKPTFDENLRKLKDEKAIKLLGEGRNKRYSRTTGNEWSPPEQTTLDDEEGLHD